MAEIKTFWIPVKLETSSDCAAMEVTANEWKLQKGDIGVDLVKEGTCINIKLYLLKAGTCNKILDASGKQHLSAQSSWFYPLGQYRYTTQEERNKARIHFQAGKAFEVKEGYICDEFLLDKLQMCAFALIAFESEEEAWTYARACVATT